VDHFILREMMELRNLQLFKNLLKISDLQGRRGRDWIKEIA